MQSAEDRRRLMKDYSAGQSPLAAVLKCVTGIAILFAVAAGPWVILSSDGFGITADAGRQIAAAVAASMAESRRVFEERRQRFEGARENTKAALAK